MKFNLRKTLKQVTSFALAGIMIVSDIPTVSAYASEEVTTEMASEITSEDDSESTTEITVGENNEITVSDTTEISTSDQNTTETASEESGYGFATVEAETNEDTLLSGLQYFVYSDEELTNEVGCFAISYDGKSYVLSNENVVYNNVKEVSDDAEINYLELETGTTYYAKMSDTLFDSTDKAEDKGIVYDDTITSFSVTSDNVTKDTAYVVKVKVETSAKTTETSENSSGDEESGDEDADPDPEAGTTETSTEEITYVTAASETENSVSSEGIVLASGTFGSLNGSSEAEETATPSDAESDENTESNPASNSASETYGETASSGEEDITETEDTDENTSEISEDENLYIETVSLGETETSVDMEETATSTDAEEEITYVTATKSSVSLLATASLFATISFTNEDNNGYYGSYGANGGTFYVTYNGTKYYAFCGDHDLKQPGDNSSISATSYTSNSDVRRFLYHTYTSVADGNYSGLTANERFRASLCLNYLLNDDDVSSIYENYLKSFLNSHTYVPLRSNQINFTLGGTSTSSGTVSKSYETKSTTTINSEKVNYTENIYISGNSDNDITVKLPAGMYMKYNGSWYGSSSSEYEKTIKPNCNLLFGITATYNGSKTAKFTGESGFDVYYWRQSNSYQRIFWGVTTSAKTASLTVTNTFGYLRILKTSDVASTSSPNGCSTSVFTVYKDSDHSTPLATATIGWFYTKVNGTVYYGVGNSTGSSLSAGRWNITTAGTNLGLSIAKQSSYTLTSYSTGSTTPEYFLQLPAGTYYIVESNCPSGYKATTTSTTVTITSGNTTTTKWTNEKNYGSLLLKKYYESGFGNSYCAGLSNYSAGGAVYKVYTTTGNGGSKGSYIGTFTTKTDCNGYVTDVASGYWASSDNKSIEGIEYGSWVYVIETEASKGCQLDTEVHYAQITKNNASVTVTSYEPVNADPLAIKIQKADSVTGETSAAGKGTLSGAEFTVKYYDVDPASYTTLSSISGLTATRTWTFETDENGRIFCNNSSYYTGGDNLYYDGDDIVIPYGVVTIEETSAPLGYTTEGSYFFNSVTGTEYTDNIIFATVTEDGMLYYNGTNFVSADNVTLIKEETIDRADIKLVKVNESTGEPISGVAFSLTSVTTGESHILVTDENGVIDTSAISHTKNTNANDDANEDDYAPCGIWFYGNSTGTGDVDDLLGALPYDTYILSELSTDANIGYELVDDITVDLSKESLYEDGYYLISLGDISDTEKRGGFALQKNDSETGTATSQGNALIPGATYTLYNENSYSVYVNGKTYAAGATIMTFTTNEDSQYISATDLLPYGTYRIVETKTPTGYLISDDDVYEQTFSITSTGQYYIFGGSTLKSKVESKYPSANLTFVTKSAFTDTVQRGGFALQKNDYDLDDASSQGKF